MHRPLIQGILILLLSSLFAIAKNPAESIEIPLYPYQDAMKSINVTIGGKTYPFLFDTGGGLTLITPELAKVTHCKPRGRLSGFRMSGERLDFKKCGSATMKLDSLTLTPKTGLYDLNALLPKSWPTLYGALSLHTFQKNILTIDLRHNRLILESEKSFRQRIRNMSLVPISIGRTTGGRAVDVFVEANATYGTLRLLMDSGNIKGYVLSSTALEQLSYNKEPKNPETVQTILQIEALKPQKISAYLEPSLIHDGALPATWMEQYIITIDLPHQKMWIKPH